MTSDEVIRMITEVLPHGIAFIVLCASLFGVIWFLTNALENYLMTADQKHKPIETKRTVVTRVRVVDGKLVRERQVHMTQVLPATKREQGSYVDWNDKADRPNWQTPKIERIVLKSPGGNGGGSEDHPGAA